MIFYVESGRFEYGKILVTKLLDKKNIQKIMYAS
jgi:hypothetical protein